MKKLLLSIVFSAIFFIPSLSVAQDKAGDGAIANPYPGTFVVAYQVVGARSNIQVDPADPENKDNKVTEQLKELVFGVGVSQDRKDHERLAKESAQRDLEQREAALLKRLNLESFESKGPLGFKIHPFGFDPSSDEESRVVSRRLVLNISVRGVSVPTQRHVRLADNEKRKEIAGRYFDGFGYAWLITKEPLASAKELIERAYQEALSAVNNQYQDIWLNIRREFGIVLFPGLDIPGKLFKIPLIWTGYPELEVMLRDPLSGGQAFYFLRGWMLEDINCEESEDNTCIPVHQEIGEDGTGGISSEEEPLEIDIAPTEESFEE